MAEVVNQYKGLAVKKYAKKGYKCSAEIRHWKKYKTALAVKESSSIQMVKFPRDVSGQVLVAAGIKANLYDLKEMRIVKSMSDAADVVTACGIRPDGKITIAGNRQGAINVYQTETKYVLRKYASHKAQVNSIDLGPSKIRFASGANDSTIKVWDFQESNAVFDCHAHDDSVSEVLWIDNEEHLLLSAGYDCKIRVWDTRMSKPLVGETEHELPIEALAFAGSGEHFMAAYGNACAVWDIRKLFAGGPLITIKPHLKSILALAYDRVRDRIITCSADSMVKFSDPHTGKSLYSLKTESPVGTLDISHDSNSYAMGCSDGSLIVRCLREGEGEGIGKGVDELVVNTESQPVQTSKNYRYFYRGAYVKAREDEIKAAQGKKVTLQEYERYFKQFEYRAALLEAAGTGRPEVVCTVVEEMIQRNVLVLGCAGLDPEQLQLLLAFLLCKLTNAKYAPILLDLASLLLDMYSSVFGLSKKVVAQLKELKLIIDKEYDLQKGLIAIRGILSSIHAFPAVPLDSTQL